MFPRIFIMLAALLSVLAAPAMARTHKHESTITGSVTEAVTVTPGKKLNFKQSIEAVSKAHQAWKKAHLNTALYSCQRNGEQTATLARKVSDKMEAAKTLATKEAQSLAKSLAASLDSAEDPATASFTNAEISQLKDKLAKLESAQKKSEVLERLAGQVKNYYVKDAPRGAAFSTDDCQRRYGAALEQGVKASSEYYTDSLALRQKLEALAGRAKTALAKQPKLEMVAGR